MRPMDLFGFGGGGGRGKSGQREERRGVDLAESAPCREQSVIGFLPECFRWLGRRRRRSDRVYQGRRCHMEVRLKPRLENASRSFGGFLGDGLGGGGRRRN